MKNENNIKVNTLDIDPFVFIKRVKEIIPEGKKYYVKTYGCQQNEADSEHLCAMAEEMGYTAAESLDIADLILINTCAVREHAEVKAMSFVGRLKELKQNNPDLIIGVCGCAAAQKKIATSLKGNFPYVSFAISPLYIHTVPYLVYGALTEGKRGFFTDTDSMEIVEGLPTKRADGYRAWVSVMYGCNNFCSYCIVPYTRGRERSRCSYEIINECKQLIENGVKEITLLGQNVNSYHSDIDFPELMRRIAMLDGDFVLKFMTSHPKDVPDELISLMGEFTGKIAPSFHLPVQSGSNTVLERMNRPYTKEKYLLTVSKLRQSVEDIYLSTDIIVGFPGESENDFLETLELLKTVRYDMVYAFIYSKRRGTPAALMEDQVPREVAEERLARLIALQETISLEKTGKNIGKVLPVTVESISDAGAFNVRARTVTNIPVHFNASGISVGERVNVLIEEAKAYSLNGKIVK